MNAKIRPVILAIFWASIMGLTGCSLDEQTSHNDSSLYFEQLLVSKPSTSPVQAQGDFLGDGMCFIVWRGESLETSEGGFRPPANGNFCTWYQDGSDKRTHISYHCQPKGTICAAERVDTSPIFIPDGSIIEALAACNAAKYVEDFVVKDTPKGYSTLCLKSTLSNYPKGRGLAYKVREGFSIPIDYVGANAEVLFISLKDTYLMDDLILEQIELAKTEFNLESVLCS